MYYFHIKYNAVFILVNTVTKIRCGMVADQKIVMNDKFFSKFVNVIGKTFIPQDSLSLEDRLDQTPTFKNGVFYVASELSNEYSGTWELANCKKSDENFLYLATDKFITVKQERSDIEIPDMEAIVDGKTFGLISSLLALGLLWYIANSRKGANTMQYSRVSESIERELKLTTDYFLIGEGRKDITQQEYREIESMNTVVMEFAKYKYEM